MKRIKINMAVTDVKLYYVCWIVAQTNNLIFDMSEIGRMVSGHLYTRLCDCVILLMLFFKAIYNSSYSAKKVLVIVGTGILTIMLYILSSDNFIIPILFLLFAKNVDIKRFFTIDMYIRFIVWVGILGLSLLGVINNYTDYINGSYKSAFGWGHPNSCAVVLLIAFMELIYLRGHSIKKLEIFLILGGVVFLYYYCEARTYLFAFFAVVIWIIIASKIKTNSSNLFAILYASALPICIFISFFCVYLYRKNLPIGIELNQILTGRLAFANQFIDDYGFSLLGQNIVTIGSRQAKELNITSAILDMAYIRIPIKYGIITLIIYVVAYTKLCLKLVRNNRFYELMFIMYIHLIGIPSTVPTRLYSNMTLMFLWVMAEEKVDIRAILDKLFKKNYIIRFMTRCPNEFKKSNIECTKE